MTSDLKHKKRNNIFKRAAVLSLVSALLVLCAVSGLAADTNTEPTLTLSFRESAYLDSLTNAGLKADLYLLAEAVERPGELAYDFRLVEPFTKLVLPTDDPEADWETVAQTAISPAITDGAPLVTGAPLGTPIKKTDAGDALPLGIYLMLIRGKEPASYLENSPDGEGKVTVAYSGEDKFLFAPELITLPARASTGDMIFDVTAYPKFERADITPEPSEPVVQTGDDTPSLAPLYITMGTSGLLLLILLVSTLIRRRNKKNEQR